MALLTASLMTAGRAAATAPPAAGIKMMLDFGGSVIAVAAEQSINARTENTRSSVPKTVHRTDNLPREVAL